MQPYLWYHIFAIIVKVVNGNLHLLLFLTNNHFKIIIDRNFDEWVLFRQHSIQLF